MIYFHSFPLKLLKPLFLVKYRLFNIFVFINNICKHICAYIVSVQSGYDRIIVQGAIIQFSKTFTTQLAYTLLLWPYQTISHKLTTSCLGFTASALLR